MKKDDRKLEALLGDKRLQPSKAFERQLRTRLRLRRRWNIGAWGWSLAAMPLLILTILGLTMYQPSSLSQYVGISALYGKALAAQQLADADTTFWQFERRQSYGPAAQECTRLSPEQQAEASLPQTILIFNDEQISASMTVEDGKLLHQRYSDDPEVKAIDMRSFSGETDFMFAGILGSATLVDRDGNPLHPDTKVPAKTSGEYDLYARPINQGGKDRVPGCENLMIHATISGDTQTFRSISVYKDRIDPNNLSFALTQELQTGTGSFSQHLPTFTAHGFDVDEADLSKKGVDYVTVENTNAGYVFAYQKSVYGTAKLEEKKDAAGKTVAYHYTFSKLPSAFVIIRTPAASDDYPATPAALRTLASQNGWSIGVDWKNTFHVPDFGAVQMAGLEAIGDGKRRLISETGSPYLPTAYSEGPDGIIIPSHDPHMPDYTLPPISVVTFKPGGQSPTGR